MAQYGVALNSVVFEKTQFVATDKRTNKQTDKQTNRQTEGYRQLLKPTLLLLAARLNIVCTAVTGNEFVTKMQSFTYLLFYQRFTNDIIYNVVVC